MSGSLKELIERIKREVEGGRLNLEELIGDLSSLGYAGRIQP